MSRDFVVSPAPATTARDYFEMPGLLHPRRPVAWAAAPGVITPFELAE